MYTVLITGFESYWDYPQNSSLVAAMEAATTCLQDEVRVIPVEMPVSFMRVAPALKAAVEQHHPDLLLMLGQSGGSERIKLERIAINMMECKIADNDGYIPDEEPIYPDEPSALFTNTHPKRIRAAIEQQGVTKVKISNSAGLYVCNRIFYEGLHLCRTSYPEMRALFIHLPYYEGQTCAKAGRPMMPLSDMVRAIHATIQECFDEGAN